MLTKEQIENWKRMLPILGINPTHLDNEDIERYKNNLQRELDDKDEHNGLLEAAKHLGACDLSGETIEYRCLECVKSRKAIVQAEGEIK